MSLSASFVIEYGIQEAAFHVYGFVSTPTTAGSTSYPHGGTRTTAQQNPTSVLLMMFKTEPSGDTHSPKPREVTLSG